MKTISLKGFTIVELLVVIVVIGILASITTVAYGSVTSRARNTQVISAAGDWVSILNGYASLYGTELANADDTPACLGSVSDYPATSDFDAGYCVGNWGAVATDANNQLMSYAKTHNTWTNTLTDNFWGEATRGIQYAHNGILGSTNHQWIIYSLQGDVDCGLSGATKTFANDVTTCEVDVNLWID